jgi:uncharacterized SAM-binding protein YcdF (DUF218 family)
VSFLRSTAFRRIALAVGVGVVLVVAATARLFVWPPTDRPTHADAVVALGGDPGQLRAQKAIALARAGYAPVALISLGGAVEAPCPHPVPGVRIVCFRADPLDTRGEAEFVGRTADRNHWTTLLLVPGTTQATRARMLFERCTTAQLVVVPQAGATSRLPYAVAYEWGALAKALLLQRHC